MPWLERHDPSIRHKARTLTFRSSFCRDHCAYFRKTIPLHLEPSPTEAYCNNLERDKRDERDGSRKVLLSRNLSEVPRSQVLRKPLCSSVVDEEDTKLSQSTILPVEVPRTEPNSKSKSKSKSRSESKSKPKSKPVFEKPSAVSIISANAFTRLCNMKGVELFTISFLPEVQELANVDVA